MSRGPAHWVALYGTWELRTGFRPEVGLPVRGRYLVKRSLDGYQPLALRGIARQRGGKDYRSKRSRQPATASDDRYALENVICEASLILERSSKQRSDRTELGLTSRVRFLSMSSVLQCTSPSLPSAFPNWSSM